MQIQAPPRSVLSVPQETPGHPSPLPEEPVWVPAPPRSGQWRRSVGTCCLLRRGPFVSAPRATTCLRGSPGDDGSARRAPGPGRAPRMPAAHVFTSLGQTLLFFECKTQADCPSLPRVRGSPVPPGARHRRLGPRPAAAVWSAQSPCQALGRVPAAGPGAPSLRAEGASGRATLRVRQAAWQCALPKTGTVHTAAIGTRPSR